MAEIPRVVCPTCQRVCFLEPGTQPGSELRCRACGAEMLVPGSSTLPAPPGQASLAGSPGDPQVSLVVTSEAPTLKEPRRAGEGSVETLLRAADPTSGRYIEQGVIGRGGMGEVVLCADRNIRREIAMKRILPEAAQDPGRRARFVEEAQVTGQLEHPNIVPVHDLERAPDGAVYYTMKLVRGRSLGALLKAARQGAEAPSLVELLQIFLKACDAIAFAHSRGVIHRDLKPSNIMLGDYGEVLVVDWGLAKVLGREDLHADKLVCTDRLDGDQAQTLAGTLVGTPAYMSPEQAEGRVDAIDGRSDTYALGAILYEMLTFERPVEGATRLEVIMNVVAGHILRPEQRAPARQVPRELADATMRCLATRKEERYASVAELRKDIALFLEGNEAWLPVCLLDFQDGRMDERLEVSYYAYGAYLGEEWVRPGADATRVTVKEGQLRLEHIWGRREKGTWMEDFSCLQWREDIGEDMRVAVTCVNEPHSTILISVSGNTSCGYRVAINAAAGHLCLESAAHGCWQELHGERVSLDASRPDWEIVVERSGEWVRASVDGTMAIEYLDPLPLGGPEHRTFALATKTHFAIRKLHVWRRRAPETVSVLETARFLLRNGLYAEAATFLEGQLSTPRGTVLDIQAQMLYGLAHEELGAFDRAIAWYQRLTGATDRSLALMASLRIVRAWILGGDLGKAGRAAMLAKELDQQGALAPCIVNAFLEAMHSPGFMRTPCRDREGLTALADLLGRRLDVGWRDLRSLEPIAGLPLDDLGLAFTNVSDLTPLRGMPLHRLNVWYCRKLADLTPLAGMRLTQLTCGCTQVSDLSPLKGMPLRLLQCSRTPVSDLSPLAGMPLSSLACYQTRVSDLRPLMGTHLESLDISDCDAVTDLTPLEGMPLEFLDIHDCEGIADLTPLAGMGIKALCFSPKRIRKGIEVVRAMKSLTQIGVSMESLMKPEDFWRRYDGGEFIR